MTVRFEKGYILVISSIIVRGWGRIATGTNEAKGAAFFPFVFVRDKEYLQSWLITHELIHFRQQFDLFFIGMPVLTLIEWLYARLVLKKDPLASNLYTAVEQEAYRNMYDDQYLRNRRFGSVYRYFNDKKEFVLTGPGEMKFLDEARI